MHLLKIMLKANGRCGVPLSNIYLTEVDRMGRVGGGSEMRLHSR
jgi:hypothetical protein